MVKDAAIGRCRIGFVGFGPRGLSVFERIATLAQKELCLSAEIVIFEPGEPGCGVHATEQPDHMLLNTIASQLGMYPDAAALTGCPGAEGRRGPSFLEWCRDLGIRVNQDGMPSTDGRPVDGGDFLPRRLLGVYLRAVFEDIMRSLPDNVSVTLRPELATGIGIGPWHGDDRHRGYCISSESGYQTVVDCIVLSTGHGNPDRIDFRTRLHTIPPRQEVLVEGLGLSAMDCLASLSRGRGGRFVRKDSGEFQYIPSGLEPAILMQSRGGLPFRARPRAHPERSRHCPLVLTPERLCHIRASTRDGKLDFDKDIIPLMLLEMRGAAIAVKMAPNEPKAIATILAGMAGLGAPLSCGVPDLAHELDRLEAAHGALDLPGILAPEISRTFGDSAYEAWIAAWIAKDLSESRQGACASAEKAAIEVWRDLRDMLRAAVDFGSLRHDSHRRFFGYWAGVINRLVAGPQKERHADLLALIDAGIVRLIHPDTIVSASIARLPARIGATGLCGATMGPVADLNSLGCLRALIATPGLDAIEIGPDLRPIGRDGKATNGIFVIGTATEGSSYYNHYVPSSGAPSRFMIDAHRVAVACVGLRHQAGMKAA